MNIRLIAVGTKMPNWVNKGFTEYAQRMPKLARLELIEVGAKRRGKNADTARIMRDEADKIAQLVPANGLVYVLDRKGKSISTEQLAMHMQSWVDQSQDVALVIGGPEGLDEQFCQTADGSWSLSDCTFAHPLVRIMVAEQLYRAWSINANLPYHRGE